MEESGESQFLGSLWRATLSNSYHPVQKGMDANLGSLDRVYEALAAPGDGKVKQPSDGDGAGVRVFHRGSRHRPFTNRKAAPGKAQ